MSGDDDIVINLSAVRQQLETADELPPLHDDEDPGFVADDPDDGAPRGPRRRKSDGLPFDCPVIPIGRNNDTFYYLDALGQFRELGPRDHAQLGLKALFTPAIHKLREYWPRYGADKQINGWRPEQAADELMNACGRRGIWMPQDRLRGPGAWLGDDGELVLHCGDALWIGAVPSGGLSGYYSGEIGEPGLRDRYVYPAGAARQRPWDDGLAKGESAGIALLDLLKTWNWKRGEIDARLLLGWHVAGRFGGALAWRPVSWVTGGHGTGKSTLLTVLEYLAGADGLLKSGDITEAAIRQTVGHSTLPVLLDEMESSEDNRKLLAIIKLARNAAGGTMSARGGQSHQASQFTVRSCFLFSSIVVPPLTRQDRSRIAILELGPMRAKPGASRFTPDRRWLGEIGRKIQRTVIDQWHRFEPTFEIYRNALRDVGHDERGADVFGTLLTMADLAMHPAAGKADDAAGDLREAAAGLVDQLTAESIAEWGDDAPDEVQFLNRLMSSPMDAWASGRKETVGSWVARAAGLDRGHDEGDANKHLKQIGLAVIRHDNDDGRGETDWLAIANAADGLARLMLGTHWATASGATAPWVQAAGKLPGACKLPKPLYFAGFNSRATLVPVETALGEVARGAGGAAAGAGEDEIEGL